MSDYIDMSKTELVSRLVAADVKASQSSQLVVELREHSRLIENKADYATAELGEIKEAHEDLKGSYVRMSHDFATCLRFLKIITSVCSGLSFDSEALIEDISLWPKQR